MIITRSPSFAPNPLFPIQFYSSYVATFLFKRFSMLSSVQDFLQNHCEESNFISRKSPLKFLKAINCSTLVSNTIDNRILKYLEYSCKRKKTISVTVNYFSLKSSQEYYICCVKVTFISVCCLFYKPIHNDQKWNLPFSKSLQRVPTLQKY